MRKLQVRGKARGKGHAHKDEEVHKSAAGIVRNDVIKTEHEHDMYRWLDHVGKAFQIARFAQVYKLAGKEKDKGDFNDLRRLEGDGEILQRFDAELCPDGIYAEPGAVAVAHQSERRQQQQDKPDIEPEDPPPLFGKLHNIDPGEEKISSRADAPAGALHDDIFERTAIHRMRCAEDQQHTVQRRRRAQRPQQHVGLSHQIAGDFPNTTHFSHLLPLPSVGKILIDYYNTNCHTCKLAFFRRFLFRKPIVKRKSLCYTF